MKAKLSAILGAFVLVLCGGCFMFLDANTTAKAEELPEKAYIYSLTQSQNKITIKGEYTDKTQYPVANNVDFEDVMERIDADRRVDTTTYYDATINFQNIKVFDTYLALQNGNYTLTGTLTGLGYSTFGLIYVNGANVVFENANFTNNGLSYLVKNEGNGNLTFKSGTYTSTDITVLSANSGNLTINGGNFVSNQTSAIVFAPSSSANLTIQQTATDKISITGAGDSAVTATGANVLIDKCSITNNKGDAVVLTNSTFELSGEPTISAKNAQIVVDTQFNAEDYTGKKLLVKYTGEIISGTTIAITNANVNKFELTNVGYTFRQSENDIVIFKTSNVVYKDSRNFITNLPVDNTNYIIDETATIKFVSDSDIKSNTLNRYNLLGWSTDAEATVAEYTSDGCKTFTFEEENLVLYAIWQPINFTISYEGVERITGSNPNPVEYNVDQTVTLTDLEKEYYDFTGWTLPGYITIPTTNLTLSKSVWGNITLTANWKYTEYDIIYNGLSTDVIQKLNLKTTYTIDDDEMTINTSKFLVDGYSCYGVFYKSDYTLEVHEKIYFKLDKQDQNSAEFLANNEIGKPINLYIDLQMYHNAAGKGTKSNPYMIATTEQFATFITGAKTTNSLYVKLKNDITLGELERDSYTGFNNITFDGDNKTLFVEKLNQLDNTFAVLPVVYNSTIQNLKISSVEQIELNVNEDALIGCAFGKIVGSNLNNVVVDVDLSITCANAPATIKVGGLTVNVENSTINNTKNLGDIIVNITATNDSVNVYGAGIVGGEAQQTKIYNTQNGGDITVTMPNTSYETRAYISALANLGANNKVYNCFANGKISYTQPVNNVAFLSGAFVVFDENNTAKNIVWLGEVEALGETLSVFISDFVGVKASYITTQSLWLASDFVGTKANSNLNTINANLSQYSSEVGVDLAQWYFTTKDQISFEPLWKVTFFSNGIAETKTKFLTDIKDGENVLFYFDTETYKFCYWEDNAGKQIDWNNVDKSVLTVYGHYELWSDVILKEQIFACAGALLILLGVLFIMFLFDKKKSVKFVLDGKVVAKLKVARRKRFKVPTEYEKTMWFFDLEGKKPFKNQRMKFHPIKLFAFTDERQQKFEAYWHEKERLEREAFEKAIQEKLQKQKEAEEKALALKKQKEELKIKKKNESKEKALALKKQKEERKQQKKNKEKVEKTTGITIIKKEIKVINDEKPEEQKPENDKKDEE